MKHYTEEDLVLRYYGERDDVEEIDAHLETCDECRARYAGLESLLGAVEAAGLWRRQLLNPYAFEGAPARLAAHDRD